MKDVNVDKLLDLDVGTGDVLDDGGEEWQAWLRAVHHL